MSQEARPVDPHRRVHTVLTYRLVVLQLGLLVVLATSLLLVATRFHYYSDSASFGRFLEQGGTLDLKIIQMPVLIAVFYAYILAIGILFALSPSEKSFNVFFYSIMTSLAVLMSDHFVLDWFLLFFTGGKVKLVQNNPVGFLQILFSVPVILCLTLMHYNILSDDLQRRFLRRGVPTAEIAHVRQKIFRALIPTVLVAGSIACALALVGEFGALIFQTHTVLPKVQLILLAGLVVPIAFLVRSILRDLAASKKIESKPRTNR